MRIGRTKHGLIFPNLTSLRFLGFLKWEEWIGIEGMREEEDKL